MDSDVSFFNKQIQSQIVIYGIIYRKSLRDTVKKNQSAASMQPRLSK